MSQNELLARIASIICTLEETGGSPESMLYIFLDMNMDLWTKVRYILTKSNLVTISGNYVTLTAEGRTRAQQINQAIERNKH